MIERNDYAPVCILTTRPQGEPKMKNVTLVWTAIAGSLLLGLAACDNKGPAERAGEKIDNAVESAKEAGETAADKVTDAAEEAKAEIKEAAGEVKEAVQK